MNARTRSYPGSGQNGRGAGRRFRAEQNALTQPYWAAWLAAVLDAYRDVTPALVARALSDRPADRDTHPRSLFRSWQQQRGTISPANAARVGEALRTLGVRWCSGALALYASRHYAAFLSEVRSLAQTVDVEYACGVFIYSRVLVDFDVHDGLPFAVQLAPRFKAMKEQARRDMAIVAALPATVARLRLILSRAHAAVADPANRRHFRLAGETPAAKAAITRYLDPALQLLESTAPPAVAWHAVLPLLDHWLHESLPAATVDGARTELLWERSRVVATLSDGRPILGSVLFDDRDILKAMPIAIMTERHRGELEPKGPTKRAVARD